MRRRSRSSSQGDLFETSKIQELQDRVKELDRLIADAMKQNRYKDAKSYTEEQKIIIQRLVQLGETDK